jgi:hypothetical protein
MVPRHAHCAAAGAATVGEPATPRYVHVDRDPHSEVSEVRCRSNGLGARGAAGTGRGHGAAVEHAVDTDADAVAAPGDGGSGREHRAETECRVSGFRIEELTFVEAAALLKALG